MAEQVSKFAIFSSRLRLVFLLWDFLLRLGSFLPVLILQNSFNGRLFEMWPAFKLMNFVDIDVALNVKFFGNVFAEMIAFNLQVLYFGFELIVCSAVLALLCCFLLLLLSLTFDALELTCLRSLCITLFIANLKEQFLLAGVQRDSIFV